MLQRSFEDAIGASADIEWAVSVRDAAGAELVCSNGDRVMKTASVGKLLLLVEVARQCADGVLSGATLLSRDPQYEVADSGLWQYLQVESLSVEDLCVLIASVSDNLATNVVLNRVGLNNVGKLSESIGLSHSALHDYVRDQRGPDDPTTLSTGSASELSLLMSLLARGELISAAVSGQVNDWLTTGVDLSMVGSAFGLDPLAHAPSERKLSIRNKTGADPGIRADVGTVGLNASHFSYAVIANWDAARDDLRDTALSGMRAIGMALKPALESDREHKGNGER
jgi:beta-lactamase class A